MLPRRLLLALVLTGAGPLLLPSGASAAFPGVNGRIVHEGLASDRGALYVRSPGGASVRRIGLGGTVRDPAFSPQGRRIAYNRDGDLWVTYADGTTRRQVTFGPEPDAAPAWSPAADALVFSRGPAGARDLYRVRVDGFELEQLTSRAADDEDPAWSSQDTVAFVRRRPQGDGDIWLTGSTRGTGAQRLTRGPADDGSPAFAPGGDEIVFVRRLEGKRSLVLIRTDGSGRRRLVALPKGGGTPAWSPDGRRIVFSAGRQGRRVLTVVRRDGRRPRAISRARADGRAPDWQPTGGDPLVAATADIACGPTDPEYGGGFGTPGRCRQRQTSDMLQTLELSSVILPGDLQYEDGDYAKFLQAFQPTWGRYKALMRPAVGNHEYRVPDAVGYFDYFNGVGRRLGQAGTRGAGYYSFDLGEWHVVALNSQCAHPPEAPTGTDCAPNSAQERWLRTDLAANPTRCTLAFWHHPLFSSGIDVQADAVRPFWRALHEAGAEVILNGHDHAYERFAPQTPDGARDPQFGLRQFVVGMGGHSHQVAVFPEPNSESRNAADYGILKLVLRPRSYDWAFVTEAGAVVDEGTGRCH